MKRYRDPTAAVMRRPEPDLPMTQRVLCAVIVFLLLAGVVWISVWADHHR